MLCKNSAKLPTGYKLVDHYLGQEWIGDNLSELIEVLKDFPKWHFDLCRLYVIKDERGRLVKYLLPFDWHDLLEWIKMVQLSKS